MYHSITIGDKNTWDDWKIIPVSRPVVAPPVEKILSGYSNAASVEKPER